MNITDIHPMDITHIYTRISHIYTHEHHRYTHMNITHIYTHEHHTHEYHTHANALLSSYGRGRERGAARPEVLQSLLSTTDRIVQEVDSVEYGLTDIQVCLRDAFGVACASLVYSVEFGLACAGLVYSVEFGMCWFGV